MLRPASLLRNDNTTGIGIGLVALFVYLTTLSPSLGYMDSGELAAAQHGLGVAHPTGYPLFTLLGRAFISLPFEARVIWKLNLSMALLAGIATFLFYRLFLFLLSEKAAALFGGSRGGTNERGRGQRRPGARDSVAAATATLALAFSATYWSEAVLLEVYALHLVFFALANLLFLAALAHPDDKRPWALFAYVLGLSFTNHMMTGLLAPAFLYLHFSRFGFGKAAWTRIGRAAPPFLLGLTPYLYLPVRAAARPLMNWGDPSTGEAFWRHVSGAQFRSFLFASEQLALDKLERFPSDFAKAFAYAPLLAAAAGLWILGRRRPKLLAFSFLLFAACLTYAFNYDFEDADFYLNAFPAAAIWIAFGSRALLRGSSKTGAAAGIAACALVFLFPLLLNYRAADRSRDFAIEDFTRNTLESADRNAVILTGAYPVFSSAAFYLQIVEGIRPDVVVVQKDLLSLPWYHEHLGARDARLIAASAPEFAALARQIAAADGAALQGEYGRDLIRSIIRDGANRPILETGDQEPEKRAAVFRGMTYRFFPDTARPAPYDGPVPRFRPIKADDPRFDYIRTYYATVYANTGILRLKAGDREGATLLLRDAVALDPSNVAITQRLRQIEASRGTPAPRASR